VTSLPIDIERLDAHGAESAIPELSRILIDCVAGNAGVSFMHPLSPEKADDFWRGEVLANVVAGKAALLVGRQDGRIVGSVQVALAMRENQPHRGEIAKLIVAPSARRQGVARLLMLEAQDVAAAEGKTLLLLDTVTGGSAEKLYLSLGWIKVGVVPGFALDPMGELDATTFLYKTLTPTP
jgi:ribosomal protein S18 acetylase RimI-like enzyme